MNLNIKYLILAIIAYIICDLLWIEFYDASESLTLKTAIGMLKDPMVHKLKIVLEKTAIFAVLFFIEMQLFRK